jgi:hypothetical protein
VWLFYRNFDNCCQIWSAVCSRPCRIAAKLTARILFETVRINRGYPFCEIWILIAYLALYVGRIKSPAEAFKISSPLIKIVRIVPAPCSAVKCRILLAVGATEWACSIVAAVDGVVKKTLLWKQSKENDPNELYGLICKWLIIYIFSFKLRFSKNIRNTTSDFSRISATKPLSKSHLHRSS